MANRRRESLPGALARIARAPLEALRRVRVPTLGRGNKRVTRLRGAGRREAARAQAAGAGAPGSGRRAAVGALLAWLIPVAVACAAFAVPFLGVRAYDYVLESDHFQVREILVEGNKYLTLPEVREVMGVEPGMHVLTADLDALAERLQRHPWVSWAKVSRELPDRLLVTLIEHEAAAYLAVGELYLVDRRGAVFASPTARDKDLALPIITGVAPERLATETSRAELAPELAGAINVAELYREMGLADRWPIGELRLDAVRGLTLVLSGRGTEAVLGRAPFRGKLFRLEWVLESLRQQGKTAEYVILDAFSGARDEQGDGRVIVKSDLDSDQQRLLDVATDRARRAERQVLGLRPDPDLFGPAAPAIAPDAPDAGGVDADDDQEPITRPTLTGGRPAADPNDMPEGEE